jgi:hypothetical protein
LRNVEQDVADWFLARLLRVKASDGYSITLTADTVFIDGLPASVEGPPVPFAEYLDDEGEWTSLNPGDRNAIIQFKVAVRITLPARPNNYKAQSRKVFDDLARACSFSLWDIDDKPDCIASILPDGWARSPRDGNYVDVVVTFAVRGIADLLSRPPVPLPEPDPPAPETP